MSSDDSMRMALVATGNAFPAKAAAADNAGAPAEPGAVGASAKTEGAAKP